MKTVKFRIEKLSRIRKHFEKQAKIASKHGIEFSYEFNENSGVEKVAVKDKFWAEMMGVDPYVYYQLASVTYSDEIQTTDWELVGISDFTEEPYMHHAFNGFKLPEEHHSSSFCCSHCGSVRKRNKRFYVRMKDTQEVLELGSECVKSYLDFNPNFFSLWSWWYSGDEFFASEFPMEKSPEPLYDVKDVIKVAAACTLIEGYRRSSEDNSTSNYIKYIFDIATSLNPSIDKNAKDHAREMMNKAQEKGISVDACIEYWMSQDPTNEFNQKMQSAIDNGCVSRSWIGILAYSYAGYLKHIEREKERAAKKAENTSEFVGEVGQRLDIELAEITKMKFIDNDWGGSHLITMKDKAGNEFITFTSGECYWKLNSVYTNEEDLSSLKSIRGTVKVHSEFNGVKQTQLSRLLVK